MNFSMIILGLITMFVGYKVLTKSEWLVRNFGRIGFFDKYLGLSGGTRLGYKLIGATIIATGFFLATGLINDILQVLTAPLVKHSIPQ